jgi:hypothetical protein
MIGHEKDEYGPDGKGGREIIGSTFDCWDKMEYILHLAFRVAKQGSTRRGFVRKSRLVGFPAGEAFELTYDEFAERYGRAIIEGDVQQIKIATPEQVAELRELMDTVRMPDDWLDKCLKRDKADDMKELSESAIVAMIDLLKKRIPT